MGSGRNQAGASTAQWPPGLLQGRPTCSASTQSHADKGLGGCLTCTPTRTDITATGTFQGVVQPVL